MPDQEAQDSSRDLPGADGEADSLEAIGKEGSPLLPQVPERTTSVSAVCHAVSPLHAAVL